MLAASRGYDSLIVKLLSANADGNLKNKVSVLYLLLLYVLM